MGLRSVKKEKIKLIAPIAQAEMTILIPSTMLAVESTIEYIFKPSKITIAKTIFIASHIHVVVWKFNCPPDVTKHARIAERTTNTTSATISKIFVMEITFLDIPSPYQFIYSIYNYTIQSALCQPPLHI